MRKCKCLASYRISYYQKSLNEFINLFASIIPYFINTIMAKILDYKMKDSIDAAHW